MLDNEDSIRKYVRELRMFYKDIVTSGIVMLVCIVAWCATGGGFWPIWVLIALSVHTLLRAIAIGRVSPSDFGFFHKFLAFLRPEWEEQQYQKILSSFNKSVAKGGVSSSVRRQQKREQPPIVEEHSGEETE
ncbi:MAG: 2TM domain-containing protein [Holosporales bacterium]|jgi:hypothetical protein|nr:2TM domain-containing protein [Holosporales bacterium]